MDCNESLERMSAYLDNELAPPAMAEMRAHIADCEACGAAYGRLADLRATVAGNAASHAAPASLRARIMADIGNDIKADVKADIEAQQPRRRKAFDLFGKFEAWPWARINFGVASVCAAALAVNLALDMQRPSPTDAFDQEIVSAHFRSLQVDHLADVVSSDHHTVKPWFSGKLDYSPPVVDLAQQGFPLIGGRLDYVHQRAVAGLAYRHDKHLINLFVWPDASQRDASAKMTSDNGFQLLRWSRDGMAYTAISDMNAAELDVFRQLLTAQIDKEKTP
ncbi:anti-sigma factor [Oxalobacteraceae bacterium CAVE-383]|nr:anti-sigma factor [Oxalobacteraceae bacterium CAVE-383]